MLYGVDAKVELLRDMGEEDRLPEEIDGVIFDESLLFEEEGIFG